MIDLQLKRSHTNNLRYVGKVVEAMAEQPSRRDASDWIARLSNGRKVVFQPLAVSDALPGSLVQLQINGASSQVLHGKEIHV
jgi:tRNA A37 methylthiotransferase MiaB